MRLWSVHPKYLDQKGLVACWREALGAKAALEGRVKGYSKHPQLDRFKECENPVAQINAYLYFLLQNALERKYKFDSSKIDFIQVNLAKKMNVTKGQVKYEREHLMNKLQERDFPKFRRLKSIEEFELHPLFTLISGGIESWEKI